MAGRLGFPLAPVLPARICPVPGPLYTVLMGYKESPVEEARRRFARRVGDLFCEFLLGHERCLHAAMADGFDLVLPVPSSLRPGPAPLERVAGLAGLCAAAAGTDAAWDPQLLRRDGGAIGHMRPNPAAFGVPPPRRRRVRGARVLLVDDLYVSGSRAQSAATALRRAGAASVLILPFGRVIRPTLLGTHAAFMAGSPTDNGHRARCVAGDQSGVVQTR